MHDLLRDEFFDEFRYLRLVVSRRVHNIFVSSVVQFRGDEIRHAFVLRAFLFRERAKAARRNVENATKPYIVERGDEDDANVRNFLIRSVRVEIARGDHVSVEAHTTH